MEGNKQKNISNLEFSVGPQRNHPPDVGLDLCDCPQLLLILPEISLLLVINYDQHSDLKTQASFVFLPQKFCGNYLRKNKYRKAKFYIQEILSVA